MKHGEVANRLKGISERLEVHTLEMSRLNIEIKAKGKLISQLQSDVKAKAPLSDFNDLLRRFNVFSEIETIEKLNNFYLPKMQTFVAHIDRFEQSNIETRDCVQKLDQDLSLKCSKSVLHTKIHELEEGYLSKEGAKALEEKIKRTESLIWEQENNLGKQFETYK